MAEDQFPYIANTATDRQEMLQTIGVTSAEELFADIPVEYRDPPLDLPPRLSEQGLLEELVALSNRNAHGGTHRSFLGGGTYQHYIPSVVNTMLSRGEFLTCYTPYQPEVAQGTLQVAFEFQSMLCQLMEMEVANAGMYDGATALAEAALMACRVTGRHRIVLVDSVSPWYNQVVRTYAEPQGLIVDVTSTDKAVVGEDVACLVVQNPNFYGYVEDLSSFADIAHNAGALLVVATSNSLSFGLLKPPGAYGADIAVAEGQPFGVPLGYGGPYVGLFTCKEKFLRQMPGRIVGRTTDNHGRQCYVLTLQTREQHIRRERATSNICTSTHLVALAVTVHLATLGKQGLRNIAQLCYHKAHYAANAIKQIPGFDLASHGTFFNEFLVRCPKPPTEINRALLERGIIGGLDVSNFVPESMLVAVTEMNTRQDIDGLVTALREVAE